MAKTKTSRTDVDVNDFIGLVDDERKRKDSLQLVQIMKEITGEEPYMYGPTIIGFGNYHYVYASGHEGDAPLAGFSPRKSAFTIYFEADFPGKEQMVKELGKCKVSKVCVYAKSLSDLNIPVLKKMIKASIRQTQKLYPSTSK